MQAEDFRASFLFVDDLNGRHQEWLGFRQRMVFVILPLTSKLCLVAINWLSARLMLEVGHLTSPDV